MSLLGWVVGAALLDEWDHRGEEEREKEERAGRIGIASGASVTLRPASGGSRKVALHRGSARGVAHWCGQRESNPHSRLRGPKSCPLDDGHEWGGEYSR